MHQALSKTAAALLLALAGTAAQAFSGDPMALNTSDVHVSLGATGATGLQINLFEEFPLQSAQLDLTWTSSAQGFVSVRWVAPGASFGSPTTSLAAPGSLSLRFEPPAGLDLGVGSLGLQFDFVGQALGLQDVNYSLKLHDAYDNDFGFDGRMQVNVVPEPASHALMLGGLALLGGLGRRRRGLTG